VKTIAHEMGSIRSVLFTFFIVLSLSLLLMQVDAQSRVEEVQALTRFAESVACTDTSRNCGYFFSWNPNDVNTCDWIGITCSTNHTVAALDFSSWGLNLTGGAFAMLSGLPDLRQLDISTHDQSSRSGGYFDNSIGSLTQLTRLDLSGSDFGGGKNMIPPNISNCRSLQYLSLKGNNFTGGIPDRTEMVNLQFLLLAENELTGPLPKQLGELSSLVITDISTII
jgi:hypothetical protein